MFLYLLLFVTLTHARRLPPEPIQIYSAKKVFVCDTAMTEVECIAVQRGRIVFSGNLQKAKELYPEAAHTHFKKKYIYPGFIDAHCHFLAYCRGLTECNLMGTKSEKEILLKLKKFAKHSQHPWIIGRGWDQNDWKNQNYPSIESLDKVFPNQPVVLKRIDGHAIWVNSALIQLLKININEKIEGGEFVFQNGKFTGIMIDNAMEKVFPYIPEAHHKEYLNAIKLGQEECFSFGLTTLTEAGLKEAQIAWIDSLQKLDLLKLRFYAMREGSEELIAKAADGPSNNGMLHVGGYKLYLDGALGSRGALMKQDYCDRPGHKGLPVIQPETFKNYCQSLFPFGWQVCVHAIGDSANSIALKTYASILPIGSQFRWRIEHAQILDTADMQYFQSPTIIPSVQPAHATSDAPWAESRLCKHRLQGAYAYEQLRIQAGLIALGTDFPVEEVSTIHTFYSAITRKDARGNLKEPFLPSQALSRKHALLGMTLWAAFANNEEMEKGSLEVGKYADFVVLNRNWMSDSIKRIKKTKIFLTFIQGKSVYKK